jgi:hypothetical protein
MEPEIFPCFLALPVNGDVLGCWMSHGDSSGSVTFFDTSPAEPAFFSIKYDWRFPFLRIWHEHVIGTYIHAEITSVAYVGVETHSITWGWWIRDHIYFFIHFPQSPVSCNGLCNFPRNRKHAALLDDNREAGLLP